MKTQGLAWLAAGVLALGLNGTLQDSGADWAHQIVDRISDQTTALVDQTSERAQNLLTEARMRLSGDENTSCRAAAVVTRWQAQSDRMTARRARIEARIESVRDRVEVRTVRLRVASAQFDPIVVNAPVECPRVRVNAPRVRVVVPNVNIQVPDVEVDTQDQNSDPI
jgi:hypothetical protein